jgi:archaemetzincin
VSDTAGGDIATRRFGDAATKPIDVVAAGEVSPNLLDDLASKLSRAFRLPCSVRPERIDPDFAFDAARGQYHSTALLQSLTGLADGNRILAVTAGDLYVPVLTFVFGEAQLAGDCAVVSIHRLRDEAYGLPGNPAALRERLLKEAVHELGHTFGLSHCEDWRCVMTSSHAVEYLDVKTAEFCSRCRQAMLPTPYTESKCPSRPSRGSGGPSSAFIH